MESAHLRVHLSRHRVVQVYKPNQHWARLVCGYSSSSLHKPGASGNGVALRSEPMWRTTALGVYSRMHVSQQWMLQAHETEQQQAQPARG